MKIALGSFRFIPEKYKKDFKAKIQVNYQNDLSCKYNAVVRFSGDMKDHVLLDLNKNIINQSVDVKLKEGHIYGITNFKLLLQKTRGPDEIFISELLKMFDYLAPRSFLVDVNLNDQNIEMLFQEKNRKELLEKNKRRESIILEGDESLVWQPSYSVPLDNRSNHSAGLVPLIKLGFKSMLSKQKNPDLIQNKKEFKTTSIQVSSNLNKIYLKYTEDFDKNSQYLESYRFYTLDNQMLANYNQDNILFLNIYNLIIMSSSDGHSLSPNNRQFYWNSFKNFYEPVSYDGNFDILNGNNVLIEPINQNYYEAYKILKEKLKNLDISTLNKNINDKNLKEPLSLTENKIQKLLSNLENINNQIKIIEKIKKSDKNKIHITFENFIKNTKKIDKNILFVLSKENNKFSLCKEINDCEKIELDDKQIIKLLRSDLENKTKRYKFIGVDFEDNIQPINSNLSFIKYRDSYFYFEKDIVYSIDELKKEFNIFQKSNNSKVFFMGGKLEDLSINIYGPNNLNLNQVSSKLESINANGLTGCLSLIDVKVKNIKLVGKNSTCEDSINLINITGEIKSVNIENAISDGLDVDFSEIRIEEVKIKNAKNDCSDFSYGKYNINNMHAEYCGDKSVSVGEQSILELNLIDASNSIIGIASKDSSNTKIQSAVLKDVDICLSAYNKKQEFYGGYIDVFKLDCSNYIKFIDKDEVSIVNVIPNSLNKKITNTFDVIQNRK